MLAVEPAGPKQSSYFAQMAMDSTLFSFPLEDVPPYPPNNQAYYDNPTLFAESSTEAQKTSTSNFSAMPATPPVVPTSQSSEPHIPSSASGPSIPSASSSAIGSPHSGTAQVFQDNWVNTNYGLGLQTAVINDPFSFSNEYMGSAVDMDGLYQEKFPDNFVGR